MELRLTADEASGLRRLLVRQLLRLKASIEEPVNDAAARAAASDIVLAKNVLQRLAQVRVSDHETSSDGIDARLRCVVVSGEVEIDLRRKRIWKHGMPVSLTRTEWRLVEALAMNAGRVMLNEELLKGIWGQEYVGESHYLPVWISRIRKKIESTDRESAIIQTIPGRGYMLEGLIVQTVR